MHTVKINVYTVPECRVVRLCEVRTICTSGVTLPGAFDEETLFDEN